MGRFDVQVEEGEPRGGPYELEQTTTYRVVDTQTESGDDVSREEGDELEPGDGAVGGVPLFRRRTGADGAR